MVRNHIFSCEFVPLEQPGLYSSSHRETRGKSLHYLCDTGSKPTPRCTAASALVGDRFNKYTGPPHRGNQPRMPIDRLRRTGVLGATLDALNLGNSGVVLTDDGIALQGRSPVAQKFDDLATEVSVRKRPGFSPLTLAMRDGSTINVGPFGPDTRSIRVAMIRFPSRKQGSIRALVSFDRNH